MKIKKLLGLNGKGEPIISSQLLAALLEKLSWLDAQVDAAVNKEYLKAFKKRRGSMLIIARPAALERLVRGSLCLNFTNDDFIILEYDATANDIPKIVVSRLAEAETKLVDKNDGLLIIGK